MRRPSWFTFARMNFALMLCWGVCLPVAIATGWIYSIAFISAASIYANFATHLAGWRADEEDVG